MRGYGGGPSGDSTAAIVGVVLCLFVFVLGACAVGFSWTREDVFLVTGHRWERAVEVQVLRDVFHEDWDNHVPFGARNVHCHSEVRSRDRVRTGEDCRTVTKTDASGRSRTVRECTPRYEYVPRYDQRCTYILAEWRYARTDRAAGVGADSHPEWPVSTASTLRSERQGRRQESYIVDLVDSNGTPRWCDVDEGTWRLMADGTHWTGRIGQVFGDLRCGSLRKIHDGYHSTQRR